MCVCVLDYYLFSAHLSPSTAHPHLLFPLTAYANATSLTRSCDDDKVNLKKKKCSGDAILISDSGKSPCITLIGFLLAKLYCTFSNEQKIYSPEQEASSAVD